MWSKMSQGSSKRTLTSGLLDEPAFNFELDRDKPPDSASVFHRLPKVDDCQQAQTQYGPRKLKAPKN